MIYRFRVILDTEEDVFRDIEIEENASLEEFHNVITQSFGFDGTEMASFYLSDDDWNQGEEISLFDLSEGQSSSRLMHTTTIAEVVSKTALKLIYVYDFLSMWTFLVELAEIAEYEDGREYPNIMFVHGQLPDAAPDKEFKADEEGMSDLDDDEGYLDVDEYDDIGFNEYWN